MILTVDFSLVAVLREPREKRDEKRDEERETLASFFKMMSTRSSGIGEPGNHRVCISDSGKAIFVFDSSQSSPN